MRKCISKRSRGRRRNAGRYWLFFLPLVFCLERPDVWGFQDAWLGATIYIVIYDAVLFWRFLGNRRLKTDVFA